MVKYFFSDENNIKVRNENGKLKYVSMSNLQSPYVYSKKIVHKTRVSFVNGNKHICGTFNQDERVHLFPLEHA